MMSLPTLKVAIPLSLFVLGAALIYASSKKANDVSPAYAGCYSASGELRNIRLTISRNSLIYRNLVLPIQLYTDKAGPSFKVDPGVTLSEVSHTIYSDGSRGNLLRFDENGGFYMPTDKGNLALFRRCRMAHQGG
jgi:hypothetical protein